MISNMKHADGRTDVHNFATNSLFLHLDCITNNPTQSSSKHYFPTNAHKL